jgi:uncharacterized phage protein gp47/JayE
MPFNRPTPFELRDRFAAEIEAGLPGADARLRRSVEEIMVRVLAIAAHDMHGHLAWAALQILVDTAEAEQLDRHGTIWGVPRRPAAPARGPVSLTGTLGATIPAGTEFRRADDARYTLDADVTLGSGATTGAVTATIGGLVGNAAAGQALSSVAPVAGLAGAVVGTGGLAAGTDIEADADLRARIIARIQAPPAGGTAADWRAWALTVAGVSRAYVFPGLAGLGTVTVAVLGPEGALPSSPLVEAVQAALDARRPVTAQAFAIAPTTLEVDVDVRVSPDTAAVRASVTTAIESFFASEAAPGEALRVSRLSEAISAAAGEAWHSIEAPAADVTVTATQMPLLGEITFE